MHIKLIVYECDLDRLPESSCSQELPLQQLNAHLVRLLQAKGHNIIRNTS